MKQNILLFFILFSSSQNLCVKTGRQSSLNMAPVLPVDVVCHIMSNLDYKSNVRIMKTCTEFYTYYKDQNDILFTNYYLNSDDYTSAMIHFSRRNDKGRVKYLIKHEGPINQKNREAIMKFFDVKKGNQAQQCIDVYKTAYDKKNMTDQKNASRRIFPCMSRNIPVLQMVLKQGYDSHIEDENGWSFLSYIIKHNYTKALRFLLACGGIDFNVSDSTGKALIYDAIQAENSDCLKILLADPHVDRTIKDESNRTLLHYCILNCCGSQIKNSCTYHGSVIKILLAEIDPNAKDDFGKTILHYAAVDRCGKQLVEFLLTDPRVDQAIEDIDNKTALHYVLGWRH